MAKQQTAMNIPELCSLDPVFLSEQITKQATVALKLKGQAVFQDVILTRVNNDIKPSARLVSEVLRRREEERRNRRIDLQKATFELSQRKGILERLELEVNRAGIALSQVENAFTLTMGDMNDLDDRFVSLESNTASEADRINGESKQARVEIETEVREGNPIFAQLQKVTSIVETEGAVLAAILGKLQGKNDEELRAYVSIRDAQKQFEPFDLVMKLMRVKDACEQRIRVCINETLAKLANAKEMIQLRQEELELVQVEREIEEDEIALSEAEISEKDRLIQESKLEMEQQIQDMCRPLVDMRTSILVTLADVGKLVDETKAMEAAVLNKEKDVFDTREKLRSTKKALAELRQKLAIALEDEKLQLQGLINVEERALQQAELSLVRNEAMLATFRNAKGSMIGKLLEKESEIQSLAGIVDRTEMAEQQREPDHSEMKDKKRTLLESLQFQRDQLAKAETGKKEYHRICSSQQAVISELSDWLMVEEQYVQTTLEEVVRTIANFGESEEEQIAHREHMAAKLQINSVAEQAFQRSKQAAVLRDDVAILKAEVTY